MFESDMKEARERKQMEKQDLESQRRQRWDALFEKMRFPLLATGLGSMSVDAGAQAAGLIWSGHSFSGRFIHQKIPDINQKT